MSRKARYENFLKLEAGRLLKSFFIIRISSRFRKALRQNFCLEFISENSFVL